jgi:hypothetical protein
MNSAIPPVVDGTTAAVCVMSHLLATAALVYIMRVAYKDREQYIENSTFFIALMFLPILIGTLSTNLTV